MSAIQLIINNRIYEGWEDLRVTRSMEFMSGGFAISAVGNRNFNPGEKCELRLFSQPVVTGFIDQVEVRTSTETIVTLQGRDTLCDLIDCSCINATGELKNLTLKELINYLIKPFNILLKFNVTDTAKISKVATDQDTIFEIIDKECRKAGYLAYADGSGNLIVDNIGSSRSFTVLEIGKNIKDFTYTKDDSQRFSQYVVKGQESGSKNTDPSNALHSSIAYDRNVTRYRPLVINEGSNATLKQLQEKVRWEASIRSARAREVAVKVPLWTQNNGNLWGINQIVNLKTGSVIREMLIKQVTFTLNTSTESELILVDKNSYQKEPIIEKTSSDITATGEETEEELLNDD